MPKEVIVSDAGFPDTDEVTLTEVRWSKDSEYVQLATVLADRSTHEPIERKVHGGWYFSLDRIDINKLIKNLRRARDQAYGRDE